MKKLRKLYFKLFPTYKSLEVRCVSYDVGNTLIRDSVGKEESERWDICTKFEDKNFIIGMVYLERKVRIYE